MAFHKKEIFRQSDQDMAEIGKIFSHPARIAILRLLAESNSCICGEIVDELPLAQSTVSQHLRELKESGIIKGSAEGTKSCYCIESEKWRSVENCLKNFLEEMQNLQTHNKCC